MNEVVLDEQTKLAQKEEAERLQRLQEIQLQMRQPYEVELDQEQVIPTEESKDIICLKEGMQFNIT